MGERAPYSRVYWSITDDKKFENIFDDDRHLATWLRLLMTADAIWPATPTLPVTARRASVQALVKAGLVDLLNGHRYRIHGLDEERKRRKESATSRKPDGDQEETKRSPNGPSRARDAMLGSSLLGSASGEEGVQGETGADAVDVFYRLTASWPSSRAMPWLSRLIDEHGDSAVADALAQEWQVDPSRNTILGRVRDRLQREAHEAEKRRLATAQAEAEKERALIETMPPEQRAANLERLGEMMAKAGLLPAKPKPA